MCSLAKQRNFLFPSDVGIEIQTKGKQSRTKWHREQVLCGCWMSDALSITKSSIRELYINCIALWAKMLMKSTKFDTKFDPTSFTTFTEKIIIATRARVRAW